MARALARAIRAGSRVVGSKRGGPRTAENEAPQGSAASELDSAVTRFLWLRTSTDYR